MLQLADDDFSEAGDLEILQLGYNEIQALNMSLLPLRKLETLNLTFNLLTEFSMQEIRGLQKLKTVDLSHNLIARLSGRMEVSKLHSKTKQKPTRVVTRFSFSEIGQLHCAERSEGESKGVRQNVMLRLQTQ